MPQKGSLRKEYKYRCGSKSEPTGGQSGMTLWWQPEEVERTVRSSEVHRGGGFRLLSIFLSSERRIFSPSASGE